ELARDAAPRAHVRALRDRFEAAIAPLGCTINGAGVERIPNTTSVTFAEADGEGIVIGLDLAGVAVSTGAACSSGRIEPSHVLTAMGLSPEEARATIRVSLSRFTTADEIDRASAVLKEVVPRTRRPVAAE
ncbi:MAG TPA: aminotransferase class V-fold PLP-dependent enzyme, partial [Thermoanaerobaculia bacterium]|nr:aminotransferase class V-fold PLP-dependent enzyme [Thermoanaerobaculia bacterium]